MKKNRPVILPAFISIILASAAWYCVEHFGITQALQTFFFGPSYSMKQLQAAAGGSFYHSIKTVVVLILIVFVVYAIIFLLVFECFAVCYFFISSKWRNPEVFISYKNTETGSKTDTTSIALAIKQALEQNRFTVHFFNYDKSAKHDLVNNEIQQLLRKSDAMVVIPDPYHPSYVDTEIQCAAYAEKPVFLIRHVKDQKLPNTANSGHLVLSWNQLKQQHCQPLVYLLQYVHKNWHTRLFIPGKPLLFFLESVTGIMEAIQTYLLAFISFIAAVFLLVYFAIPATVVLFILQATVTLIGVAAAFITLDKILENNRLQKVTRQSVLSSGKTYELFKAANLPKEVLSAIDKRGLASQEDNIN